MPTYNAILEDIRSRGFDLVPNNPDYWQEDWCCFRIVPLTAKADALLPPRLRVSLYSASYAASLLKTFPIENNNLDFICAESHPERESLAA